MKHWSIYRWRETDFWSPSWRLYQYSVRHPEIKLNLT